MHPDSLEKAVIDGMMKREEAAIDSLAKRIEAASTKPPRIAEIWDDGFNGLKQTWIRDDGPYVKKCIPPQPSPWKKGGPYEVDPDIFKHFPDEDFEEKQQKEFQKITKLLEAQKKEKESPAELELVLKALGVKTAEEAVQRIKDMQYEIDRLNTMLQDAYNDALNGTK